VAASVGVAVVGLYVASDVERVVAVGGTVVGIMVAVWIEGVDVAAGQSAAGVLNPSINLLPMQFT
jgi:hypothetical protein